MATCGGDMWRWLCAQEDAEASSSQAVPVRGRRGRPWLLCSLLNHLLSFCVSWSTGTGMVQRSKSRSPEFVCPLYQSPDLGLGQLIEPLWRKKYSLFFFFFAYISRVRERSDYYCEVLCKYWLLMSTCLSNKVRKRGMSACPQMVSGLCCPGGKPESVSKRGHLPVASVRESDWWQGFTGHPTKACHRSGSKKGCLVFTVQTHSPDGSDDPKVVTRRESLLCLCPPTPFMLVATVWPDGPKNFSHESGIF